MFDGNAAVTLAEHILLRRESSGGLLYDPLRNRLFRLDSEAFAIVDGCRQRLTREQILQLVQKCAGSMSSAQALLTHLGNAELLTNVDSAVPPILDPTKIARFLEQWHAKDEAADPVVGPLLVYLELTHKCNLQCVYCYNESGPTRTDELSTECIRSLLDEFRQSGVFYVSFTGGEPLLRGDILELLDLAHNYGIRQILATNGTLITESVAAALALAGVSQVQVSLDAADSSIHDLLRGRVGAFSRSVNGVRLLSKHHIPTTICCVATEESLPRLDDLIKLAIELGATYFRILGMMTAGRATALQEVSIGTRAMLNASIQGLAAKYSGQIHVLTNQEASAGDCGSGVAFCSISATGDVMPCSFASSVVAGNVKHATFRHIWNHSAVLRRFREAKQEQCGVRRTCAEAGCQARAIADCCGVL